MFSLLAETRTFLGIPEIWWPYVYQYGVGAVFFGIGIFLILYFKSCNLKYKADRFWFGVLMFGFAWYAGWHLIWYLAAIFILPEHATASAPAGGGS